MGSRKTGIEIRFKIPPKEFSGYLNAAISSGMTAAAQWWIDEAMAKHFEESAFARYGYQTRSGQYPIRGTFVTKAGKLRKRIKTAKGWRTFPSKDQESQGITLSRTASGYQQSKIKSKGHGKPLVWTGRLREEVMASAKIVSANRTGATIRARGRALNLSGRKNMPDMKKEITTVIPEERRAMAQVAGRTIAERMRAIRAA